MRQQKMHSTDPDILRELAALRRAAKSRVAPEDESTDAKYRRGTRTT